MLLLSDPERIVWYPACRSLPPVCCRKTQKIEVRTPYVSLRVGLLCDDLPAPVHRNEKGFYASRI